MNLIDGGQMLRPNLFRVRKILLKVPDIGISSHLRTYLFTIESMFSLTQVFERLVTVKLSLNL